MSGIEVVGVVLAVFPLIISILEHKRDIASCHGLLANFMTEYSKAWNDLRDEELVFRLQLRKLLLPLVTDKALVQEELEAFMLDAGGHLWKDADVQAALQKRLGESHDRYMETIQELQALGWRVLKPLTQSPAFAKLLDKVTKDPPNLASHKKRLMRDSYESLAKSFRKRTDPLKFAWSKSEREELICQIHQKINLLGRFLDTNDQVAILAQSISVAVAPRAVQMLLQYWKDANRVYALLYRSWTCKCRETHCAHLWLQHHATAQFDFKMLVLFAQPWGATTLGNWRQQGLRIQRAMNADCVKEATVVIATCAGPSIPRGPSIGSSKPRIRLSSILSKEPKCADPKGRIVRFGAGATARPETSTAADSIQSAKRSKGNPITPPLVDSSDAKEISNLCRELQGCGMKPMRLGSLTDQAEQCQYIVSSEQKLLAGEVTLHEVLHESHRPRPKRSQRFQIALKVASSHLKLVSTSWARKQWTSHEIRFPRIVGPPGEVLLDRPFVSADFSVDAPSDGALPKQTDKSFGCLGIMLLELLFGYQLEAHELWQQLGSVDKGKDMFRSMVARQWADEVLEEAGPDYDGAVRYCLNESPITLQGDQWRKDLANKVVLPLQNCCEWIGPVANS